MTTTFPREILVLYVDTTTTFLVGLLLGLTPRRTTHTHTLTLTQKAKTNKEKKSTTAWACNFRTVTGLRIAYFL